MKKLLFVFASVLFVFALSAQDASKDPAMSGTKTAVTPHGTDASAATPAGSGVGAASAVAGGQEKALKDHVCTEACKKAGKCVYKCGEKGHKCTAACKHSDAKELKDHVCTDACKKAGKCVYKCGEKGHKCTKECHKGKS